MSLFDRLFGVKRKPAPPKGTRMRIVLASTSQNPDVTFDLLKRIAGAVETQLYQHFAPLHQADGVPMTAIADPSQMSAGDDVLPMLIGDEPDVPDALGWHTYTQGRMSSSIFLAPILANGGSLTDGPDSLSVTISHEALEAALDPYVNDFSFVSDTLIEPKEACDRTEGDSYVIDGISVSNFLGPRAFRDGPGPYDYMQLLTSPWEVRPAGYCSRISVTTGAAHTIWGPKMPMWKRELKKRKAELKLSRLAKHLARFRTTSL